MAFHQQSKYKGYRNQQYNPLGAADPEDLNVQTDTQGFHEIKVYNGTRDLMWEIFSELVLSSNPVEVIKTAEQLEVVLLRADSIWRGIQASANLKASSMGIDETKYLQYKGEMKAKGQEVKRYIGFFVTPHLYIDRFNRYDKDFEEFMNNTEDGKIQYLKQKIEDIVTDVDAKWGELASRIGMGIPLKIAEEKELFFRGR